MKYLILLILLIFLTPLFISFGNYKPGPEFRNLKKGMTREEVLKKYGNPEQRKIIKTREFYGESFIYYYDYITPCSSDCERYYYAPLLYLVFQNGVLTDIFNIEVKDQ